MAPSGHWKNKKNNFKKCDENENETQIEESDGEHGMANVSEKKCKKIEFDEELATQEHLNETDKAKIMQLWKNMRNFSKEKLDTAIKEN